MDVEVELTNNEVLTGQLKFYELSSYQCIVGMVVPGRNPKNTFVINFNRVVRMRIPGRRRALGPAELGNKILDSQPKKGNSE